MSKQNKVRPLISVVVPVYKVEKYLKECVDSILGQTLQDIEVILVDDGSPDNCPAICDAYAKQDRRVRVIHQKNGGLGKAYNVGIAAATGKYIGMIESDDWIEPDMYERLYQTISTLHTDLVKCSFYNYNSFNTKRDRPYKDIPASVPESTKFMITDYPELIVMHASVWAALYESSFIKKIKFDETPGAGYQDVSFMIEAFCLALNGIAMIKTPLVHYRQEPGNTSSSVRRDERLMAIADQIISIRKRLAHLSSFQLLREEYYSYAIISNVHFYRRIYPELRSAYFEKLREVFKPLSEDPTFSYRSITPEHKKLIHHILSGNRKKFESSPIEIKKIFSLFKFPLIKKSKTFDARTLYFMNIPISRKPTSFKE